MRASSNLKGDRVRVEPPPWATQMVSSVCLGYDLKEPKLEWWKEKGTGEAESQDELTWAVMASYEIGSKPRVRVVDEGDLIEGKIRLLHELAHHVAQKTEGLDGHEDGFWRICWKLFVRHHIPLHRAIYSEFSYLAKAEKVFKELGIVQTREMQVAAALGAATRRRTWLSIRIRGLKAQLENARASAEQQTIKRQVRVLRAQHKVENAVVAKKMPVYKRNVKALAYKRSARTRVYKRSAKKR